MDLRKALDALISPKWRLWFILGLGICGMLLILLSRNPVQDSGTPSQAAAQGGGAISQEYVRQLEEKLGGMIGEIEGVGAAKVMITLQNSGETIFARTEKRGFDRQTHPAAAEIAAGNISEQENTEQGYVIVENENGRRQALVQAQLEPAIQGVIIICDGADDIYVQSRVVNAVSTAFGIPSTRVCVEKIRGSPE
jgi:stage III sporulation protein AG